jgi:prepilin-type N-terminal cleavage/methylation domain-containing protein
MKGYTLTELLVSITIITIIAIAGSALAKNVISYNSSAQASLDAQLEGKRVLKIMVAELRTVAPSVLGSYPLETVATSSITFYADINGNGQTDRVRYFIDPTTRVLKKGVTAPSGSPLTYNLGNEQTTTLITDIANGTTTDMFEYYDASYAGTSTPLAIPVDVSRVRLVKITAIIDRDPNRSPTTISLVSEVSLRNLKDNL